MKSFTRIGFGVFAIWLVSADFVSSRCHKVTPVPIDEKFLFEGTPFGGWYPRLSKGVNLLKLEHYVPKPDPPMKGADKKMCWQAPIEMKGQEIAIGSYDCTYRDGHISEQHCNVAKLPRALESLGVQVPSTYHLVIVDTDNKTFVAWEACGDGESYNWQVLAKSERVWINERRVYGRIGITRLDGDEAKTNPIKLGRTTTRRGSCRTGGKGRGSRGTPG